MASKNISINNAIIKLQNRNAEIDAAIKNGLKECAKRGTEIALENLHSYTYKNSPIELEQSIKSEKLSDKHSQIIADGGCATYIEYGTGIVGKSDPHSNIILKSVEYNLNKYGEKGWIYSEADIDYRETSRQPSRPFMYNTKNKLIQEVEPIMKKYLEVK